MFFEIVNTLLLIFILFILALKLGMSYHIHSNLVELLKVTKETFEWLKEETEEIINEETQD